VKFFSERHSVTLTYLNAVLPHDFCVRSQKLRLDIRSLGQVNKVFEQAKPDAVIHVAGNKNVRFCEENPAEAAIINGAGTRNIAQACQRYGAHMTYLSTDLVFDCLAGGFKETDRPTPLLTYGKTKLAGEEFASRETRDLAICRSGGIYGLESPLLDWVAKELNSGREVVCLTNVVNTPTYTDSLAEMIEVIVNRQLTGVFHAVGRDAVNRFEFFRTFASVFGLNSRLLRPVESEEMMRNLLLQPNASLDATRTSQTLGIRSTAVLEGMTILRAKSAAPVQAAGVERP
jgi:dTDP-4-dehydrorhamnose reductase